MHKEIRKISRSREQSFHSKARERKWNLYSFKISNNSKQLSLSTRQPPQVEWAAYLVASSKLQEQVTMYQEVSAQRHKVISEVPSERTSSSLKYRYQWICKLIKPLIWWCTLSRIGILSKNQLKKENWIAEITPSVSTRRKISNRQWAQTRTNISLKHTTAPSKQSRIRRLVLRSGHQRKCSTF